MTQPTRSEAIKRFLGASTLPDLARLYNSGLEVQVNVAQDGGQRTSTEGYKGRTWHSYSDGVQVWSSFRMPKNSFSIPEENDFTINYSLAEHAEGIGLTGWDWKNRVSKWVGFDFDAIITHSSSLTDEELQAVKKVACAIPWITVRKSTSGTGLHLYVFLDNIPTENHNEHAALARAILGKLTAITGFDFNSKVDVCGHVLWVWHRKMKFAKDGLALIKQGEKLKDIPINWKDHLSVIKGNKKKKDLPKYVESDSNLFEELTNQRIRVKLDEQHKRLLTYLDEIKALWWWDQDRNLLVCHTYDLKTAHQKLGFRGIFDTVATGKDTPNDQNAFCCPLERPEGAWSIRRFSLGVQETSNWTQDSSGFTQCYYNREPTLDIASRTFGGIESARGDFQFTSAERAVSTAKSLGALVNLPEWAKGRTTELKQHKDGRLIVAIKREGHDPPIEGWREDKNFWKRIFNARLNQPSESEALKYDHIIRHIISPNGSDLGWVLKSSSTWREEPYVNIRLALKALDLHDTEINNILGKAVFEGWTITNDPFQPEFPGNRKWNRKAAQYRYKPKEGEEFRHPTWQKVLNHCGRGLDLSVANNGWCRANSIKTGADYLKIWVASLFQYPKRHLPYLFLYSKEERTGKTTFHEAIGLLMTHGYIRADLALISGAGFNGELENALLCAIEETDLQKNHSARNRIKDWVTSDTIMLHHKGKTPYQVTNSVHFIQTGNGIFECPVFTGDTRITVIEVPPFELTEMLMPTQLKALLEQEAPDFLGEILSIEIPPSQDRLNVPVIDTDLKTQTQQLNRTTLEVFLDEICYYAPGEMVLYSDLYNKFLNWLDPSDVYSWSKIKFGRDLPTKYPKGRVMAKGAQFYIGNLSFDKPESIDKPKLILRGDRLEH